MQRGLDASGGLGPQLVGEKINVNRRVVSVVRQLGEGGFSFVYLAKDISEDETPSSSSHGNNNNYHNAHSSHNSNDNNNDNQQQQVLLQQQQQQQQQHVVLKVTSIHSRQQRDIAEKEAKLLSRLSHPSIVRMIDSCYRTYNNNNNNSHHNNNNHDNLMFDHLDYSNGTNHHHHHNGSSNIRHHHLILMEYCESGTALSVCNNLKNSHKRFDLPSLIIAFGQICNAVSYLHAQRPPIVHRDLKPVNFLVKNGAYKVCDFGSAVFGHVDLRTSRARTEAEEVIQKTTTQMFRSPEMVDLYMSKKLTQSTDVWALGTCLYSLAFLQNCFEEGSNLAILSRNYKIPEDNPYGSDLVELIDRMLTVNCRERADMTEVILCLSAMYSGKPLPKRKKVKSEKDSNNRERKERKERVGTYRTDGQGIRKNASEEKRPVEAKKLNPNSAAARRRKAAEEGGSGINSTVLLTKQSSKIGKLNLKKDKNDPFYADSSGLRTSTSRGRATFSQDDDPFQIGKEDRIENPLSFFSNKDSGTDASSQDWGGDFSSENGSGFENFGSSDDSSRSTIYRKGAAAFLKKRDISDSVPPFTADLGDIKFSNFGVDDKKHDFVAEEGFEATYNDDLYSDATASILADINEVHKGSDKQKRKKKGIKGLFGKGEKI